MAEKNTNEGKGTTKIETRKLRDLAPDTANANKGTQRGNAMLEHSLQNLGAGRSILLDKDLNIIAGNKTHGKAGEIGMEDIILVHTDGTKLVAVVRDDLHIDDPDARLLAYADNRTNEVDLSWDADQLAADLDSGMDLSAFFTEKELADLLSDSEDEPEEKPECEFTPELMEEHQYLVLYFDNSVDWQTACSMFNVQSSKALDSRPGYERRGIGRVLRGADIVRAVQRSSIDREDLR